MKITIVSVDDWSGLYVDGVLKLEGHSLEPRMVIEVITGEYPESIWADREWAAERGSFPDLLEEVKQDV
jgi:hypothetical protein